jgi:3'-phosphoadenosine 5'-phosphosulfate (PAPS) 3'-phosphatase
MTRLTHLCRVTHRACNALSPMVSAFYQTINSETSKHKADASFFTIADGIVQYLLVNHLFSNGRFLNIVGEEDDNNVQIDNAPYTVDDLTVPAEYNTLIDQAKNSLNDLSTEFDSFNYKDLTVFIDPIDGTREFSTGLGEQCSICIGFASDAGKPVAGIVYRPITKPETFAMGAASEGFTESHLDIPAVPNHTGFLTSNGGVSPFLVQLMSKLGYQRVPSGGAGNKMLMLLEGKGGAYIQDRGVSRWGKCLFFSFHVYFLLTCLFIDTCAAQAVIEAHGGVLAKLTSFVNGDRDWKHYTYLKSNSNLDFEANTSNLTPFNSKDKKAIKKGDPPRIGTLEEFQAYSNICGLIALSREGLTSAENIFNAVQEVKVTHPPSYD